MKILRLKTVDAFVAFDFECPISAGGTRLAPDVTERETQLLARAMSYKFAVLGVRLGGAKGAIRAGPEERDGAVRRYRDEIRPLVEQRRFLTSTDLGTRPEDFESLPTTDQAGLMHTSHAGMPLDAYLTGVGVATAAETALGGLQDRTVALEGFGKVGGATAMEVARRGARLVAVSTVSGCIERRAGFDVEELLALRAAHGDRMVEHLGARVRSPTELFRVQADALVPGARTGVIDETRAAALDVRVVAPAANVPYTAGGLRALRRRGIPALADFVCNAGATIGYVTAGLTTQLQALATVEQRVRELTLASLKDPEGAVRGASRIAEGFLRTWVTPDQVPDGPPLA